jgi:hypothetical protein
MPIAKARTKTKVVLMVGEIYLRYRCVSRMIENLLTFAFCSPIVQGGRGNGKRVAFSSIASLALTNCTPPVENSEP